MEKNSCFSFFFRTFVPMMKINQATLDYIRKNTEADIHQLALRGTKDPEVDLIFALDQIAGRQKARMKLPTWAAIDGIIYPPHLSMEQCSNELTARYKASVSSPQEDEVRGGNRLLVDLTGGFGVDFAFMAKNYDRAVYIERQPQLCTISSENFRLLGIPSEVVNADGIDYLHQLDHADLIYIDPARRNEHGGRTYGIADCTPNVLELMDELMTKTDRLLLKLSPMLDWRKAVADINGKSCTQVTTVHIVSVENECKELLIEMNSEKRKVKSTEPSLCVVCVNLFSDGSEERFDFESPSASTYHSSSSASTYHSSLITHHYLLLPNASIMKAGCFELLSVRYGVMQLDKNSHLFVSDRDVPDFPGRRFIIEHTTSMNKRELKDALSGIDRANITVRNFPLSVSELRKRLKLKDGGNIYIFATTVQEVGLQLFICRKY